MAAKSEILSKLREMEPTLFENLVFDCMLSIGMSQAIWRTPGTDGGRDIECILQTYDLSGHSENQKWYVECKRYKSSIDWPTIYSKASYAVNANADFLLLVTTSNPSTTCENEILKWNSEKKLPKIRCWRGYELEKILSNTPSLIIKYGLSEAKKEIYAAFQPLSTELMKLTQASYAAFEFGKHPIYPIEAAAAISELMNFCLDSLEKYGKVENAREKIDFNFYDWMIIASPLKILDELGFRAIASTARHITHAEKVHVQAANDLLILQLMQPNYDLIPTSQATLNRIALWTSYELNFGKKNSKFSSIQLHPRKLIHG